MINNHGICIEVRNHFNDNVKYIRVKRNVRQDESGKLFIRYNNDILEVRKIGYMYKATIWN